LKTKCNQCGTVFNRVPCLIRNRKYHFCSTACKGLWQTVNLKGSNNPHWKGGRLITKDGYIEVIVPGSKPKTKYILEHRLVMEQKLGRKLTKIELVHHLNGIRTDNRIDNLSIVNSTEHERRTVVNILQKRIRELERVILSRR